MLLSSMKMNLDYIRTFTVLGQSRNMTEASRKLGVDTSYVSRHMKQLEEELQTKLIVLNTKSKEVSLTDAGQYFFEKYEKIYNDILLTEKNYRQVDLDGCKIALGVSLELENLFLKSKLQEFTEEFPSISIKLKNGNFDELLHDLLQYSVDFILCKLDIHDDNFPEDVTVVSLSESKYCFAYNPDNYHYSSMEDASVILPFNNTDERRIINSYFSQHHLKWKRSYEVESFDRMMAYVLDGFGLGFMLRESAQNNQHLKIIDLDIPVRVCIAYLKDKVTPSTEKLLHLFLS